MFLMDRLVSRSSRSLAVMVGAAITGRGRARDDLRGSPQPAFHREGHALSQHPTVLNASSRSE